MTIKLRDRNVNIAAPRPNWSNPVGVEYTFKTGIITSRDGTEQRHAQRQTARVALTFTTAMTQALLSRHHGDMVKSQEALWAVRAEWAWVRVASDAVSPTNEIVLEEVPDWMVVGQAVIIETPTNEDWFEVDDINGTTITISDVSTIDYPAGSKVYLAYWTRVGASSDFTALTNQLWTGAMRYDVNPGGGEPSSGIAPAFFHGYDKMFLKKPNWRTGPKITFLQDRDVFDPGIGLLDVNAPWAANVTKLQYAFTGLSREDSEELVTFFHAMKGRRTAFWVPDWNKTVLPSDTQIVGDNIIQIDGSEFRSAYNGDPTYQSMIAFYPNCGYQANTITSYGGTTDTEITFEDDWSQEINSGTRLYWLVRARFESDTLNVSWMTNLAAEVTYALRTLPHDMSPPVTVPAGLLALIEPDQQSIAFGDLEVKQATPQTISKLVKLSDLGFTDEMIDREEVMAYARYAGSYQEGAPLVDFTTTFKMDIAFHDAEPVNYYDDLVPALGGDVVSFSAVQGPGVDVELAAVTVPATARWVSFRANYVNAVTSSLTLTESTWGISGPKTGSFAGTSLC